MILFFGIFCGVFLHSEAMEQAFDATLNNQQLIQHKGNTAVKVTLNYSDEEKSKQYQADIDDVLSAIKRNTPLSTSLGANPISFYFQPYAQKKSPNIIALFADNQSILEAMKRIHDVGLLSDDNQSAFPDSWQDSDGSLNIARMIDDICSTEEKLNECQKDLHTLKNSLFWHRIGIICVFFAGVYITSSVITSDEYNKAGLHGYVKHGFTAIGSDCWQVGTWFSNAFKPAGISTTAATT